MKLLHFKLLGILGAALGAAYLALPTQREQVTMLIRDHYKERAMHKLEIMYAAGDRNPENIKSMIELFVHFGKKKELFEPIIVSYLKKRPNDEVIVDLRLWMYEVDGRKKLYLSYLESLVDRLNSRKYFSKLIGQHRLNGRAHEEVRVLEKYRPKKLLRAEDFWRLGAIYADKNKNEQALSAFREMDGHKGIVPAKFVEARLTMFRVLLENGYAPEAVERSNRWVQKSYGSKLIYGLMREYDKYGRFDLALELGQSAMRYSYDRVFVLVDFLNSKKQFSLSRSLLAQWKADTPKLKGKQIHRYIKGCINAADTASAMKLLMDIGVRNLTTETTIDLAEEFVFQKQHSLLNVIRPYLSYEMMKKKPVMAAKLAMMEGEPDLASDMISDITPSMLEVYEYDVWMEVMVKLLGSKDVFYTLKDLFDNGKLPRKFFKHYAQLARKEGRMKDYKTVSIELGGAFPVKGMN